MADSLGETIHTQATILNEKEKRPYDPPRVTRLNPFTATQSGGQPHSQENINWAPKSV